jgi:hypothetical protein
VHLLPIGQLMTGRETVTTGNRGRHKAGVEVQVWANGMDNGLCSRHIGLGPTTVATRPMAMLSQASSQLSKTLAVPDQTKPHPHPTKMPRPLPQRL